MLQYGQMDDVEFMPISISDPKPSAWNDDIWIEKPNGKRKSTSITILMSPDAHSYDR